MKIILEIWDITLNIILRNIFILHDDAIGQDRISSCEYVIWSSHQELS